MRGLAPKQTNVLEFFADAEDSGRQPSRAEVAEALGYAFPSAVSKHVDALEKKGYLETDPKTKRNVRLTGRGWAAIARSPARSQARAGIPIIGAIAAGTPILAEQDTDKLLEDLRPAPNRFALRVRGDSMVGAGILDGDYAIIEEGGNVPDGRIGAVLFDGEATLKRVRRKSDRLELHPENPAYEPIRIPVERADDVRIIGPLLFVHRLVR